MISGECRKTFDIRERDLALERVEAVADDERAKGNPERMHLRIAPAVNRAPSATSPP